MQKTTTIQWSVVFLLFTIEALYFWVLPPNFLDEGIWLELTHWVSKGMKPYVDFPTVYGPFYLRVLSAGVTLLGGKLISLRLFMGCIQGLICFILLNWSLKKMISQRLSFLICLLCFLTIAHPSLDATMFWGLRYYSAFMIITPLCFDLAGKTKLNNFYRQFLFFMWGPLFFYSGEAGVIAAPVVGISILSVSFSSFQKLEIFLKSTTIFLVGILLCFLILNKESLLYSKELLIEAPVTYHEMGFSYPKLSIATIHFYFPFFLFICSVVSMIYFKMNLTSCLSLGSTLLALIPALKVATSRSDEVHLAYAYPFVIFLTFLLITTSSSYITRPKFQLLWRGLWGFSLFFCLFNFFSFDSLNGFHTAFSAVNSKEKRRYNPNWGIWMTKENYISLKEASQKIAEQLAVTNHRLFVFPFQQILYSELGIMSLNIEPIQPCSLKSSRSECSRNFNYTFPDHVLWIPEGSMYSWAFDAYFSGFEYPEAFETLEREFKKPTLLGKTGWFLYERSTSTRSDISSTPSESKLTKNQLNYFEPRPEDFEKCEENLSTCPYLEFMSRSLRLANFKQLTCLKQNAKNKETLAKSFGIQLQHSTISQVGINVSWVCKNTGSPDCSCSRVRVRSSSDEPYAKWVWSGFAEWNKEDISRLSFFGVSNR